MDPEVETLAQRVQELERRVDLLFSNTGAIDMDELGRGAPEPSQEVRSLVAKGDVGKAAKLYREETGGDMATTLGALGKLK